MRMLGLALKMLLDAPSKSLGTLAGVVVSVFLMSQQLSILLGILGLVSAFADGTDADLWVASAATENTELTGSLPATRVSEVASTPGVAWAAPVIQGMSRITRPDGVREPVMVVGVEPPRYAGLARTLVDGTRREELRGTARVFLSWTARPVFAFPPRGERLEIDGKTAFVAGYFDKLDPHSSYSYVFANLDDARAYTGFPQDRVTFVAAGVAPGEDAIAVRQRLQARLPDALAVTRDELSAMEVRHFLRRTPVGMVFGMGTMVAAFIGSVIVAITLYSSVIDRLRDYGTLKALGATRRDLFRLLLAQAWLFFAVGCTVGLLAFFFVKAHATQAPMLAPPWMLASVVAASFLSCTLASLAAVRRALAIDPAIVFRG
ncbi:ABC transporter permease [Myxococcus sp. RHSTA-1-4]|uniref:ABC transporter permease n=1 Tax=Myxococcus sp. RHSTA-1-4 TaxID=2874601 RepID=UPI001CC0BF7C|nr:ABC transporter permease [Myxococcus sp. RHSTA-1-4]MBZ4415312.1 ABC transporter permease [Myxococcus sp. RHSTA-1-4]